MSRSRLLLLLVVLLVISLWYAWQETPRQQKAANKKVTTQSNTVSSVGEKGKSTDAALDFTGGEKLAYKKPKRDLFRPLYRTPVVKNTSVAPPEPAPVVVTPTPPQPPPTTTPVDLNNARRTRKRH